VSVPLRAEVKISTKVRKEIARLGKAGVKETYIPVSFNIGKALNIGKLTFA
jgi:hypothetical protein